MSIPIPPRFPFRHATILTYLPGLLFPFLFRHSPRRFTPAAPPEHLPSSPAPYLMAYGPAADSRIDHLFKEDGRQRHTHHHQPMAHRHISPLCGSGMDCCHIGEHTLRILSPHSGTHVDCPDYGCSPSLDCSLPESAETARAVQHLAPYAPPTDAAARSLCIHGCRSCRHRCAAFRDADCIPPAARASFESASSRTEVIGHHPTPLCLALPGHVDQAWQFAQAPVRPGLAHTVRKRDAAPSRR